MMNITLFEHGYKKFNWTDRHMIAFERLRQRFGMDILRCTVRDGQRVVQAAQYVGVVRLGIDVFEILPKIYKSHTDEACQRREAAGNLLNLLTYANSIKIRQHDIAHLYHHKTDWFEILTHLFVSHLAKEWQRGVQRNYRLIEDESPALKGKWLTSDQARKPERKHIFSVAYDEFTSDNQLNRVFRFVVERMWHLSQDPDNRRLLTSLRQWMEEVTLLAHIKASDAPPHLVNRLNQRYEPILNLARLFLDCGTIDVVSGDLKTFAFVFDMNQLFEQFVVGFISRHRKDVLPDQLRDCSLLNQTRSCTRYLASTGNTNVFRLRPDLAFHYAEDFPLLLDAKYKHLNPNEAALGVSQDDFYQMFAYSRRYSCPRLVLIYPQTATIPNSYIRRFDIKNTNAQVLAATIDIRSNLHDLTEQLTGRFKQIFTEEVANG